MPTNTAPFSALPARATLAAATLAAATLAAIALVALVATAPHAAAQSIALFVNGDPITNFDIEQRTKLIEVSTRKAPPRKAVIDELIDEKLKIQLLKRYKIEDIDKDVDNAFANMARRMRATPQQFAQNLAKSGIQTETIKSRIRAELVWSQIVRGRFQASFQVNEMDVLARLQTLKPDEATTAGVDYTLRPILFIVPRGSPPAVVEARRRDAEALRARFSNCRDGIVMARGMRDVAVRPPVTRSSADLQPAVRDMLDKTEIGRLTAPELTMQGVEVHALCDKKPSSSDNLPGKREAREQLMRERFDSRSREFLKELRSQAMIEYR